MSWTVTIHFTEGDRTCYILREGFILNECMGRHGRHETQSVSLKILDPEVSQMFMIETAPHVKAEIYENGVARFLGVVRPSRSFSAYGDTEQALSMEILDYTEVLKVYPAEDTQMRGTGISNVIYKIMELAGLSGIAIHNEITVEDFWDYFVISSKRYLCDTLEDFLCEYGMDFRFAPDGMHIIPTTVSETPENRLADVRGNLNVSRDDSTYDGVEVSYKAQYKYVGKEVYSLSKEFGEKKWWDSPLVYDSHTDYHAGLFFPDEPTEQQTEQHWDNAEMHDGATELPEGAGWAKFSLSEFEDEEILNVKISNVTANLKANSVKSGTPQIGPVTVHENDIEGFRYSFPYSGNFKTISYGLISGIFGPYPTALVGWTFTVKALADVVVRGEASTVLVSNGARDTKQIKLDYVNTGDLVRAYAEREAQRLKTSCYRYSFESLTSYEVGRFYTLTDSVTGISSTVRIISRQYDGELIFRYVCEGAGAVEILEISAEGVSTDRDDASRTGSAIRVVLDNVPSEDDPVLRAHVEGDVLDLEQSFEWYLNGYVAGTGPSIEVTEGIAPGTNTLMVASIYEGDWALTDTVEFTNRKDSKVQIEYAVNYDPDTEPAAYVKWADNDAKWGDDYAAWMAAVWSKTSPNSLNRGAYVWIRTRVDDGEWQVSRITTAPEDTTPRYDGIVDVLPSEGMIQGDSIVHRVDGELVIKVYDSGEWKTLAQSSLTSAEKSEILAKSQADVFTAIQAGSVTSSEYAYFNAVVAQVITADYIKALEGVFNNITVSGDSYFFGKFNCPTIESLPNTTGGTSYETDIPAYGGEGSSAQHEAIVSFFRDNGLSLYGTYPCTSTAYPTIAYIRADGNGYYFYFYNESMRLIGTLEKVRSGSRYYYIVNGITVAQHLTIKVGASDILKIKGLQATKTPDLQSEQLYYTTISGHKVLCLV